MTESASIDEQLARVCARFEAQFGRRPRFAAAAPGRVNLIGEHTDYNAGFVLPLAIERQTVIVADRRPDRRARLISTGVPGTAEFDVTPGLTPALAPGQPSWSNYVRGVIVGCLARGLDPAGFDAAIDSTVPTGSGLSSSAALEVATATLVEALTAQPMDPVAKALLCQEAEHRFAGVPCGIMDQFISAMGQPGAALLIDCRSYETRPVKLADPTVVVLIINSNVQHALTGGEYAQRRSQCEAAAQALGVPALRDATMAQLQAHRDRLDDLTYRRARHVISENQRTLDAADALTHGDWAAAGQLMFASHASLRDDFEVSVPELDLLVDLAAQQLGPGGVFGSRMTGGGFGGCTVSLVQADAVPAVSASIAQAYREATGIEPTLFATRPAAGARILNRLPREARSRR